MNYFHFINIFSTLFKRLIIFLLILVVPEIISESSNLQNELKHVHVIFAHKLYAPLDLDTKYGFPENLDYKYFLENSYEMPNEAKMEIYDLGIYLRRRYDDFLGDIYYAEILKMHTSEHFLSMISGLLVNAGLWPPAESQRWNDDLNWQPIPSEYEPMESDRLFLGTLCPHFLDEEKRLLSTDESIKNKVSVHEPLFNYVSEHYGKKIERPSDISLLYSCLESIASDGRSNGTLPGWAKEIFPDGDMLNITLLSYDLLSMSKSQKHLNGGVFLKKIIDESIIISKSNNSFESKDANNRDFKISMYSGEERNVIGLLQAMQLWWSPHLLENGASVIFELRYNHSAEEYGFEIYYYTGIADNATMGLTLPGCESFCPLKDFAKIVAEVLPGDEEVLCNLKSSINNGSSENGKNHIDLKFLPLLTILLVFFMY